MTAGLIADGGGNLFGTTYEGGAYEYGTVFEIAKTASGYASTPTTPVSFNGTNGTNPWAGLISDASGVLYGTTSLGGNTSCSIVPGLVGCGTVFEIAGSGFVVPVTFAGMLGKPNCPGQSVSALAQQYGGLDAAAAALGYSSLNNSSGRLAGVAGAEQALGFWYDLVAEAGSTGANGVRTRHAARYGDFAEFASGRRQAG